MILLPFLPPAALVQAEARPFDFAAWKLAHVDPQSNPALVAALDRLHQDCPGFRAMLAAFAADQPRTSVLLGTMTERSYGQLGIVKVQDGFLIHVGVQAKLVDLGFDSYEPWLGSLLFALAEVSRADNVVQRKDQNYRFNSHVQDVFWSAQTSLRIEFEKAPSAARPRLTLNYRDLFKHYVLGRTTEKLVDHPYLKTPLY